MSEVFLALARFGRAARKAMIGSKIEALTTLIG